MSEKNANVFSPFVPEIHWDWRNTDRNVFLSHKFVPPVLLSTRSVDAVVVAVVDVTVGGVVIQSLNL